MDIFITLSYFRPGEQWVLTSNDYDGLEWLDSTPKPTLAELESAWAAASFDSEKKTIQEARRQAYILTADPLFFGWQRGDNTEQEWLDAVQAVKDANPYPVDPSAPKKK